MDHTLRPDGAPGRGGQAAGSDVESVGSLTRRIKDLLESSIPTCWVRGEVSNLRAQASGHFYFSLKDADSQIAAVMFRGDASRGGAAGILRDGAQVIVYAQVSVYEPRGNYQLIVRAVVDDGVGRLQQEFERLKRRLAAEGLFDADRKQPLPLLPATIGFITSPTGAAVQDFMRILKRRRWRGRLIVLPVKVQGTDAAAGMVAALDLARRLTEAAEGPHFELLVVGRGGGSIEDLWAFNEEPLVRAVAACPIPIISAVGHEIDFTLCDFAADVRAETPSAAAELITSRYLEVVDRLGAAADGMDQALDRLMREHRSGVEIMRNRLAVVSPSIRVERGYLQLDDLSNRLAAAVRHGVQDRQRNLNALAEQLARVSPEPMLARARERMRAVRERLWREVSVELEARTKALSGLRERMDAAGPDSILRRGYVIVRDAKRRPITQRACVKPGDHVTAQWHDGEAPLRAGS